MRQPGSSAQRGQSCPASANRGDLPDAEVVLSYGMPTYRIGRRRLNIGVWKHGLSLYVSPNRDGGFSARHPELAQERGPLS
jgi:hypothetical protein